MQRLRVPLLFVGALWLIHLIQVLLPGSFGALGIYPRTFFGLRGILLAPMIHADFQHLLSNSIPLLVLSAMILFFYPRVALRSMLMIYLLTGVAVWLFARKVFHIGASGVVYGLVAFVFWSGIFRRNLKSIVLALVVTLLYSGYFEGILPNQPGISWESHLLGGLVGMFTAFWYKNEVEQEELMAEKAGPEEEQEERYFLPRDTFDVPKNLRKKRDEGRLPWSKRDF